MANHRRTAVRQGIFKLNVIDGQAMLFDLDADLGETSDLADTYGATVAEMTGLFERWNERNRPAIFPGYSDYHRQLKAFHQEVLEAAEAADSER
jgi:hypothetical protein